MGRCIAKTRRGTRCQRPALKGTRRCAQHPTAPTPKRARAGALFLEALADTHLVTEAAKRAGIHRDTAYEWRKVDLEFAREWAEIEERSTELLEREAYRRAAVGIDKPVYYKGERVDLVKEYSDVLLMFLLKARRPDSYRENHRLEHAIDEGAVERLGEQLSRLFERTMRAVKGLSVDQREMAAREYAHAIAELEGPAGAS